MVSAKLTQHRGESHSTFKTDAPGDSVPEDIKNSRRPDPVCDCHVLTRQLLDTGHHSMRISLGQVLHYPAPLMGSGLESSIESGLQLQNCFPPLTLI